MGHAVCAVARVGFMAVAVAVYAACPASADPQRLLMAYAEQLSRIDGNWLVWRDGTRMTIDEGRADRDHEAMLASADIKDMFAIAYPRGPLAAHPARNSDPGRARHAALFDKMYGDCTKGEVARHLTTIPWLPKKRGGTLQVTTINRVHEKLAAVSAELDALPASFDKYLIPSAGTYVCRPIAGTTRVSAHGHGIAIDIALAEADYWRWAAARRPGVDHIAYRNRVPYEIVSIFERHGFIWGGKWYHYDSMHFEYRPELLQPN